MRPRLDEPADAPEAPDAQLLAAAGFTDVTVLDETPEAAVYRAVQPALSRAVAVRLQRDPVPSAADRRRFAAQCALLGRLGAHPNIPEVFGCDVVGDRPYVVMELPSGETVADRLVRGDVWSWHEVVDMAIALAGALATAHRAGVVHGDLSAASVRLSAYGRPQLADLGFGAQRRPRGQTPQHDVRDLAGVCAAMLGTGSDVPASLQELLAAAQDGAVATAAQLGRALQQLQVRLGRAAMPLPLHGHVGPTGAAHRTRATLAVLAGAVVLAVVAVGARQAADTPAVLEVQALGGDWQPDTALAEQLAAAPDAYLCQPPPSAAQADLTVVEAHQTPASTARVGITLRALPPGAAAALLDEVGGQAGCLAQLDGLTQTGVETVDIGGAGVLLHYRRADAQAPVEIAVLVGRRGDLVGQAVHLGYPRTDPAVTSRLQRALTAALRAAGP